MNNFMQEENDRLIEIIIKAQRITLKNTGNFLLSLDFPGLF